MQIGEEKREKWINHDYRQVLSNCLKRSGNKCLQQHCFIPYNRKAIRLIFKIVDL